jgi:superoxide dismutase
MNVHYFTNHKELREKLMDAIKKNKEKLFSADDQDSGIKVAD